VLEGDHQAAAESDRVLQQEPVRGGLVGAPGHDVGGIAGHGLAEGSSLEVVAAVEEVLGAGPVKRRGAAAVDVDPLVAFQVGPGQAAGVGRDDSD
jgi:hypothetical protein